MRLNIYLTPPEEITESKLVVVHVSAPHVKCPMCRERNTLSKEFWQTVISQGFNDVPGCCPECRALYTIRVKESLTGPAVNRTQMKMFTLAGSPAQK